MHSINRRKRKESLQHREIDLFDLLLQLWNGKKIILCCMAFALTFASAYLLFHKPKWVSTAVVSLPETGQVADYTDTLLLLYPQPVRRDVISNTFLPSIFDIRSGAYERFSTLLSVREMQDEYKKTVKSEMLKIIQTQPSNTPNPIRITFTADSSEDVDGKLRTFIEQVNADVQKHLINDLKTSIDARQQELKSLLAIQDKLAKKQRTQRLDSTGEMKQVVLAAPGDAGVNRLPVVAKNDSGQQLDFGDEYLKTQEQLLKLSSLVPEDMKIGSFFYMEQPTAPQKDKSSNKITLVLLSLILGGVVGAGIVLSRNVLRHYQRQR